MAASALVLHGVLGVEAHAETEAYECRSGERERRVALRYADDRDRLPCEVLYWRDAGQQSEPRVLWTAEATTGFCVTKAEELMSRLENAGWSCTRAGTAAPRAARSEAPAAPTDGAPPARTEAPEPVAEPEEDGTDVASGRREILLQEAISRDIARLNQLTGSGRFELVMADLGDIDEDGVADAAAVVTFKSAGKRSHYLIAYVFKGSTYQPVAKTYLGGSDDEIRDSQIETIDDGAIQLRLSIARPGDPACCPSGKRRTSFVLEDGRLVEAPVS